MLSSDSIIYLFNFEKLQNKKEVKKWLEDAKELNGYAERDDDAENPLYYKKIIVTFKFKGKNYTRISTAINFLLQNVSKYNGKAVSILYSPKYDQVMILRKPTQNNNNNQSKEKE